MTEIVPVVDVPVQPAGSVQVNVYGVVPPVTVEVQVNALPDVVGAGQLRLLVNGFPPTLAVVVAVAVALPVLESFAVLLIEYMPFGEHVTEMVAVVDVPVHPVGRT